MTAVKICGIRTLDQAIAALSAGADMLGFVFYRPVFRYVEPGLVAEIVRACRSDGVLSSRPWQSVGVFVNTPAEEINAIARRCHLDLIQLAGDETTEFCTRIEKPIVRVLRAQGKAWTAARLAEAQAGYRVLRFMVDSHVSGFYGGTGVPADWDSLAGFVGDKILAGGLRPDNVAQALRLTRPWGVDVSSGVERDGVKDPELIRRFMEEVRAFDSAD